MKSQENSAVCQLTYADVATVLNALEYLIVNYHGYPIGSNQAVMILYRALEDCKLLDVTHNA